jgi:hypothetical protein
MGVSLERCGGHPPPPSVTVIAVFQLSSAARYWTECRTSDQRCALFLALFGIHWWAAPYSFPAPASSVLSKDVPTVAEKCDRFVVVVLTTVGNIVER